MVHANNYETVSRFVIVMQIKRWPLLSGLVLIYFVLFYDSVLTPL